ncbi:MAG: hypothetical protein IJU95_08350, partial [Treponema sp.]|nr:hypothetical protein [Treponema sp.]
MKRNQLWGWAGEPIIRFKNGRFLSRLKVGLARRGRFKNGWFLSRLKVGLACRGRFKNCRFWA